MPGTYCTTAENALATPATKPYPAPLMSEETKTESAAVEPIQRSSSPAAIANVMATAVMAIIDVVRVMLKMFATVRKPLSQMVKAKNTRITAKKI